MNLVRSILLATAILLAACVPLLSFWIHLPWTCMVAETIVSALVILRVGVSQRPAARGSTRCFWAACAGTTVAVIAMFVAWRQVFTWDPYYGVVVWCIAGLLALPIAASEREREKRLWLLATIAGAFLGTGLWLGACYAGDLPIGFYFGLVTTGVLLLASKVSFRMPATAIQVANTFLLLLVGLPLVDLLFRPSYRMDTNPATARRYYSYDTAKNNPAAFSRWWNFYLEQWHQMGKTVFMPDPNGFYPFLLRPGSHGMLFQSRIDINSLGLRGKEFEKQKAAGAYRILALGESTTFGCTMNAEDKPWPELLEQMIQERLKPARRVEVINAGVPSYDIHHNNHRLATELLGLKPDLVISYHGYNGFAMLYGTLPPPFENTPPAYHTRPLKLLADCEYRARIMRYKKQKFAKFTEAPPTIPNPMESEYAREYQVMVDITRTNQIRLAVATFSMAVNRRSNMDLVEFYRGPFPAVHWQIQANEVLAGITKRIAEENGEICWIDTHPNLDGQHEKFIDLVHFTQTGRQQLAENIFAGLEDLLKKELGLVNPTSKGTLEP
ncbi:MAG TPA: GDSL-type esterase/lipase family protein [Candidatus Dormibacteraeota bacterium]|nr:GDSL-type esterase/lipase family protein [Candidatus Dormibacteraeota bacterium]